MTKKDDKVMSLFHKVRGLRTTLIQKRKGFTGILFSESLLNNCDKFLSYEELVARGNVEEKIAKDLLEIIDRIFDQSALVLEMMKRQIAIEVLQNIRRPN